METQALLSTRQVVAVAAGTEELVRRLRREHDYGPTSAGVTRDGHGWSVPEGLGFAVYRTARELGVSPAGSIQAAKLVASFNLPDLAAWFDQNRRFLLLVGDEPFRRLIRQDSIEANRPSLSEIEADGVLWCVLDVSRIFQQLKKRLAALDAEGGDDELDAEGGDDE